MFTLNAIGWLAVASALTLCAVCGMLYVKADTFGMAALKKLIRILFPKVRQLSPSELADWLADPQRPAPLLLDVRRVEEYRISHLPHAERIDPYSDAAKLSASLSPERPVVVYCSVGYRSSALANRLLRSGFTNISNLEGSIFAWGNEGRPLECEHQSTSKVHPYHSVYARLLKPGKSIDTH